MSKMDFARRDGARIFDVFLIALFGGASIYFTGWLHWLFVILAMLAAYQLGVDNMLFLQKSATPRYFGGLHDPQD